MKKVLVATAFILVMLAVTSITSLADVVCINEGSGSSRRVSDCSECRNNETCGGSVTVPQRCEPSEAIVGFDAAGEIICEQFLQNACTPETEACDYIDNDCDGEVDEDFTDLNTLCLVGVGACERAGIFICSADGSGTECNAVPGVPEPEVCGDGFDNDCDGAIDEADSDCVAACVDDIFEDNDHYLQATFLGTSNQLLGLTSASGDSDWFYFQLLEGQQINIEVYFAHAEGNIDIYLYDSNLNIVSTSDSVTDNESIVYTGQAPPSDDPTHYLEVRMLSVDSCGEYDLVINLN